MASGPIFRLIVALLMTLIGCALYLLPTIIAAYRRHHQQGPIAILNIFLGWTFLGWVVALAWSSSAVRPPDS